MTRITIWWRRHITSVGRGGGCVCGPENPNNETPHHHQQSHRQCFGPQAVVLLVLTTNIFIDLRHAKFFVLLVTVINLIYVCLFVLLLYHTSMQLHCPRGTSPKINIVFEVHVTEIRTSPVDGQLSRTVLLVSNASRSFVCQVDGLSPFIIKSNLLYLDSFDLRGNPIVIHQQCSQRRQEQQPTTTIL